MGHGPTEIFWQGITSRIRVFGRKRTPVSGMLITLFPQQFENHKVLPIKLRGGFVHQLKSVEANYPNLAGLRDSLDRPNILFSAKHIIIIQSPLRLLSLSVPSRLLYKPIEGNCIV